MSRETAEWLNRNVLVGFTDKRGKAWHYRASDQGDESNHYPGAIPVADVHRRLFNWQAVSRRVAVEVPAPVIEGEPGKGTMLLTGMDENGIPVYSPNPGYHFNGDTLMMWTVQDDRQAIATSDNHDVLGHFKSGYQPHQYDEWLVRNVSNILDDGLAIGSAGLLKNRAVAWVQVEVPENITTPEGVEFRPNLLATTSFDGTVATTYKRTVTDVVCDNTRDMAMSEAGQTFKARHSKHSGFKLGAARDALAVIHTMADDFAAEVKELCAVEFTNRQWAQLMDAIVPIVDEKGEPLSKMAITKAEHRRERLTGMWNNDDRCAPWTNTVYGVTQTFNTYFHHERPTRGTTNRVERNMEDAIKGGTAKWDGEVLTAVNKILAAA